jgi:PAS domain-containing protein
MPSRSEFDIAFDDPDLAARVEALAASALDTLPYGVVQLDRRARVQFINQHERDTLGIAAADVRNLDFFNAVSPDFGNANIRDRIEEARREEPFALDIETMECRSDAGRPMRLRVRSSSQGGIWLFIKRDN